jgi:hypothetical protein
MVKKNVFLHLRLLIKLNTKKYEMVKKITSQYQEIRMHLVKIKFLCNESKYTFCNGIWQEA